MFDRIKEIICDFVEIDPEDISADSKLTSDLGLCSLDLAMLSSEIEKEYGVSVSAKTFATLKSVGNIAKYIEEQL